MEELNKNTNLNDTDKKLHISDVRQRFIYLLSSDGHRDSVSLDRGSLDIEGLKKLLIDEQKEYLTPEQMSRLVDFLNEFGY